MRVIAALFRVRIVIDEWSYQVSRTVVLIAATIVALGICTYQVLKPASITAPAGSVPEELLRCEKLWANNKISSYRYTFRVSCFCDPRTTGPVIIEVRNGATASISPLQPGIATNVNFFDKYASIDKIFQRIKDALHEKDDRYDLDGDKIYTDKDGVRVKYNAQLGYPIEIEINPNIPDADVHYTISNFEVVQ